MKIFVVIYLSFCIFITLCKGQEPVFVQPYNSLGFFNPALSSYYNGSRITSSYQNYSSNQLYSLYFDNYIKNIKGTIACRYQYEEYNDAAIINGSYLSYSTCIILLKEKLMIFPSVELGWRNNSLKKDRIFPDMLNHYNYSYNPNKPISDIKSPRNNFDINTGIMAHFQWFYLGASIHHLTEPKYGLLCYHRLPIRYIYSALCWIPVNRNACSWFSGYYMEQNNLKTINISSSLNSRNTSIGIGYNVTNYSINSADFSIARSFNKEKIKLGYSFRLSISNTSNQTFICNEINILYTLKKPSRDFDDQFKSIRIYHF